LFDQKGEENNTRKIKINSIRRNKRGASAAISSVILTAGTIVLVLVAMGFANTFLDARLAENEFATNKQFLLTTALQIDDIAWTVGRTQTVRFTSKFGWTYTNSSFYKQVWEHEIPICSPQIYSRNGYG